MKPFAPRIFWSLAMIVIPVLTLIGPAPVLGDATTWQGSAGSWFEPTNWDNGVPASDKDAFINGGTASIVSGETAAAQNIHFGVYSGASGTITQTGGTLTVSGTTPGLMLGSQSGGSGYYNLEGGSLSTPTEAIGNGGYGEFLQKVGTTHTVATGMTLGQMTGGEGKYTLEGGSLSLGSTGSLFVGGPGSGTFIMQNGTLETGQETIGAAVTGTFTQTGGTHTVANGLNLGQVSGGEGTYNLEGGSLETQGVFINHGEFLQKAGSTHTVRQWLNLGAPPGGDGKYTLEGGSLNFASATGLGIGNGGGTGTFT